jgi:hypothetical protein
MTQVVGRLPSTCEVLAGVSHGIWLLVSTCKTPVGRRRATLGKLSIWAPFLPTYPSTGCVSPGKVTQSLYSHPLRIPIIVPFPCYSLWSSWVHCSAATGYWAGFLISAAHIHLCQKPLYQTFFHHQFSYTTCFLLHS